MTMFRVFYMRPDYFRDLSFGDKKPNIAELSRTHVELRTVEADSLEALYSLQQAHNWAKDYETTNALLESKGLSHTSMSVGDVAENTATGDYYVVANAGFKKLAAGPAKPLKFQVSLAGEVVAAFVSLRAADDYCEHLSHDFDSTMIAIENDNGELVRYSGHGDAMEYRTPAGEFMHRDDFESLVKRCDRQ